MCEGVDVGMRGGRGLFHFCHMGVSVTYCLHHCVPSSLPEPHGGGSPAVQFHSEQQVVPGHICHPLLEQEGPF